MIDKGSDRMKKWVSLIVVMLLVFSSFDWRVLAESDTEGPKVLSYNLSEGSYTVGDVIRVEAVVKDNQTKEPYVSLFLKKPETGGEPTRAAHLHGRRTVSRKSDGDAWDGVREICFVIHQHH